MNTALKTRPLASRRGFTLVEVLATMMFMTIVLPYTMDGIMLANSMSGLAKNRLEAISLAESKLNEIVAEWQATDQIATTPTSGEFGPPEFPGLSTRYVVEMLPENERLDLEEATAPSTSTGLGVSGLIEVTVRVTWMARGRPYEVRVSTFIYPPTSQQNAEANMGGQP